MARGEFARYEAGPKFLNARARCGVLVSVCALCCVFQVCFRFDPQSCHEFSLETKRGGEEQRQKEDKGEESRVEKSKRRQELKKAVKREREREKEGGRNRETEDFHFCLHLAAIVDSVTSLGGSVAATDQRRRLEYPVLKL